MIQSILQEQKLLIFLERKENKSLRDSLYYQSMDHLNTNRDVSFNAALALGIICSLAASFASGYIPLLVVVSALGWCVGRAVYFSVRGMTLSTTGHDYDLYLKFLKENEEKYAEFKDMVA